MGIVGAASQGLQVEAREAVDGAGVAADVEELGVLQGGGQQVRLEVGDGVFVADGPLVPVVGDLFPAFLPLEVAGRAGDGEEGLEDVLVEDALEGCQLIMKREV